MASELIKHISDASFDTEVIQAGKPVLVDYWAEWCGPCKMIAPSWTKWPPAMATSCQIAKMNVDEEPRSARQVRHPRHPDA